MTWIAFLVIAAFAQTSTSKLITSPADSDEVDQTDQIVTNKMMRAQIGSLSKFSVKLSSTYNAGSLQNPLDPPRPNIAGTNNDPVGLQSLGGSVGVRYRLNQTSSIGLSGGFNMMTPFHGAYTAKNSQTQQSFDRYHQHIDLSNPNFSYSTVFKWQQTSNVISVGETVQTSEGLRDNGYLTNTGVSHTIAYEIPETSMTAIFSSSVGFNIFDKPASTPTEDSQTLGAVQNLYQLGMSPTLEYRITDRLAARGQIIFTAYHVRDGSNLSTLKLERIFENVGLGIGITRDIYLFPSVSFLADDLRSDRSNVSLSADLSIF